MPVFICKNDRCSNNGKREHYPRVTYKWNDETKRLEADESFCPLCGTFREPEKEYDGWTKAWFKDEINRNYNNKTVKKYDYDHRTSDEQTIKINKKLFV